MVEQEKKWGSEIVEGSAAKVLTDLSTLYSDKGERQIVETIIFPHFRARLAEVLNKFMDREGADPNRPIIPGEIDGLLSAIDGMIEENRALLDLDGILKPVAGRILGVRTAIAETLKARFYQHCREILAGHGVVDRQNLLSKGPRWFLGSNFSPYGKGTAFAGRILEKSLTLIVHIADLERIADVLGFEKLSREEELQKYREALASHGITDRQSLLKKGPVWFTRTEFSLYGKGCAFAGKILGRSVGHVGVLELEKIADVLGFEKLSREEELQKYREILVGHGVTDRQSLLSKRSRWFAQADFPPYGKGRAFAGKILGDFSGHVRVASLDRIADVLGFEKLSREEELQQYRMVLVGHGVTDRQSLLSKGVLWFIRADFSPYGKGISFAGEILGRVVGGVCFTDLEQIADVLGFEKLSREEELQKYREILAGHGVTDRQSLLSKGSRWFSQTGFSPYGKGTAFAGRILGKSLTLIVHIADLERIADVLGFEKLSREEELQRYRMVLVGHGVTDRQSLLSKGIAWFLGSNFSPYGKGKAFAGEILGRSTGQHVHIATLEEIAGILFINQ
ncbi:hypothetical protein A3I58_00870 [Candidatus Peregrinibacteria bacterium RIFCSPLOWO2_02_FULL_39_10]|nr:MAG: hypothetical protein A3I58_00870 [Candidatus Peregrinibacteria bacterium RIFCSPLOWO2_02_FULL_39_10]